MRRLVAIPLLLLMLAAFLAPAALATVTPPVRACCRAAGAHHCATIIPSGSDTQIKGQCCPYRKLLAVSGSAATPRVTQAIAPAATHSFLNQLHTEVFISYRELPPSHRGPPDSSLK